MSLNDSFNLLASAEEIVLQTPNELGSDLKLKFDAIFNKNPDLVKIVKFNRMMNSLQSANELFLENLSMETVLQYKYAPLTSCDVERSFSAFKMVLSEKRQKLTMVSLEKIMVIYCNSNYRN